MQDLWNVYRARETESQMANHSTFTWKKTVTLSVLTAYLSSRGTHRVTSQAQRRASPKSRNKKTAEKCHPSGTAVPKRGR